MCVEVEPGVLHTTAVVALMSLDPPPGTPREHSAEDTGTHVHTILNINRHSICAIIHQ